MQIPAKIDNSTSPELLKALRERAKHDKLWLANEVLGFDFVPEVHQELFDLFVCYDSTLPWAEQAEKAKRLILWPRGHFKSSAVVVDIIQAILNFPDLRVLIMQGTLGVTRTLLKQIAAHFTGEASDSRLTELFPEFCSLRNPNGKGKRITGKRAIGLTADTFTVPCRVKKQLAQATVTVASPNSCKTGQHYDVGYYDDLINERNYRSSALLMKARDDFYMSLPLLDPPFYVVVTGTRYSNEDLYIRIIDQDANKDEWLISVKTCWTDDGTGIRFPQSSARGGKIIGFTREQLDTIATNTPDVFASQYLNQPISTAYKVFDEGMLLSKLVAPGDEQLSEPILFLDLASGEEQHRDDCVLLAASTDEDGRIYFTHGLGDKWDTPTTALQIIQMTVDLKPLMVYLEKSAAGITFRSYLEVIAEQHGVYVPVEYLPSQNQADAKAIRISALKGYFDSDRLRFYQIPCWAKLLKQFVDWTGGRRKHDDYPDTVALAVQHLTATTAFTPRRRKAINAVDELKYRDVYEHMITDQGPTTYDDMGCY